MRSLSATAACAALLCVTSVAWAQRPEDVAAAAAAFREGQSAQLAGDYAHAAELFELADDTAPSPAALRSAIRNRQAAGQAARAASLAAEALERYPDDADTRTLSEGVLRELGPGLSQVQVRCALECSVSIDGRALYSDARSAFTVYLDAGPHTLVASWPGRDAVTRAFESTVGAREAFDLEAPAAVATDDRALEVTPPAPERPADHGLSPVVFGIGAGLTVVGAGLLVWSGVDVLSARDAYVASPSMAGYEDGVGRETRTNVLIGVTGAFAVATVVVAAFTDFGSRSEAGTAGRTRALPTLVVTSEGAVLGAGGTF